MKIIDAVLILAILGTGVAYYLQKSRPGSCYKGQIQLTDEVKQMIDAEFTKAQTRGQEIPGLKELAAKTADVEKQFADLQILRTQNRKIIADKFTAIRMSSDRKKAQEKELKAFIEEASRKMVQVCAKGGGAKL